MQQHCQQIKSTPTPLMLFQICYNVEKLFGILQGDEFFELCEISQSCDEQTNCSADLIDTASVIVDVF